MTPFKATEAPFNKSIMNQSNPSTSTRGSPRENYFVHSAIVDFRKEEIPAFKKSFGVRHVVRIFRKDSSVFATWKQDDPFIIGRALEHDVRYWKLGKVVRDKTDLEDLQAYYKKNFHIISGQYTYLSGKGAYPWVNLNDFTTFVRVANFMDKDVH
jgi:hypothetical protein